MRALTSKQKKLLDKVMIEDDTIREWSDLSIDTIDELEKINDTEILVQEVNRYIDDIRWAKINS